MNTPAAMASVYWEIVTRYPQVWVVELLALGYLLSFVARHRLYLWRQLMAFLCSGVPKRPAALFPAATSSPVPAASSPHPPAGD
jgi:hypothetical protein